ncbi:hypothetical protein Tco_1283841 [Tanacetum coccineum]
MADHSHKCHEEESNREMREYNSNQMSIITDKLKNLSRDMKNLMENVHAIKGRYESCNEIYYGDHCLSSEEAKCVKATESREDSLMVTLGIDMDSFGVLLDSDNEMGIGLEDLREWIKDFLDARDPEVYGSDSEGIGVNPSSNEFRLCNSDEWRSGNHGGRVIIRGYGGCGDMVVRHGLKGCLDHWILRSSPILPPFPIDLESVKCGELKNKCGGFEELMHFFDRDFNSLTFEGSAAYLGKVRCTYGLF